MEYLYDMESARIVSVVGYKDSGKTRVVEALVAELTKREYNVGSLKHTSENVLLDTPGKDTWRHKKAGSKATAILHGKASALFYERPMSFNEALSKLGDLDFVVTEELRLFRKGFPQASDSSQSSRSRQDRSSRSTRVVSSVVMRQFRPSGHRGAKHPAREWAPCRDYHRPIQPATHPCRHAGRRDVHLRHIRRRLGECTCSAETA